MKRYSLEEKIRIIEEFKKNNEEITGTTMYEGYPIGQWAIQIRASLKRLKNGKKSSINPTESQLERLEKLGILKSQLEATIDEKIKSMAEWIKKYPKATFVHINGNRKVEDILKEYSSNDEKYENLLEEYKKMQSYYDYARYRKSQGKLTDEQLENAKEANIRGVFGYSRKVEELAKKYGYNEEDVICLLEKYDSIENFLKLYLNNKIKDKSEMDLASSNLRTVIDIDNNPNSDNYDALVKDLIEIYDKFTKKNTKSKLFIYSSEIIDEKLKELRERERLAIEKRYALNEEDTQKTFENMAKILGVSSCRAGQIVNKALKKLAHPLRIHRIRIKFYDDKLLTDEERKKIDEIEKDIQIGKRKSI